MATASAGSGRSLFTRLLAVQLLAMLGLVVVLGLLFYLERNLTVARLAATTWAPALHRALGSTAAGPAAVVSALGPLREAPASALPLGAGAPRLAMLKSTLAAQGIGLQQLALDRRSEPPVLWLAVQPPAGGPPLWLGFHDPLIEPGLPGRVLAALLAAVLMAVVASGWLTRRLTRPLERLRRRMASHRPGQQGATAADTGAAGASAEIAAIDAAWRDMQDRLARHEAERALMLAGVSHDLRSPLARIRLAASLLPDGPQTTPRRGSIERNVRTADRLIESFLDHARAGTLPLDQPVDLAALARQVVDAARGDAADITLQAPEALVVTGAHPLLIERLLANLVDNALQHGRAPVGMRLRCEGADVVVEVQDAGDGIPPDARDAMQQAFARGDASRGRPGAGLGLAIVRLGLDRLGGRLDFERAAGCHVVRLRWPRERGGGRATDAPVVS